MMERGVVTLAGRLEGGAEEDGAHGPGEGTMTGSKLLKSSGPGPAPPPGLLVPELASSRNRR